MFLLSLSVRDYCYASNHNLILDNKPRQIINSIELNKAFYASIDNIAPKVFKDMNCKTIGNNIKFSNYNLKFIPNSLFAMLSRGDSILITQMQLPSILYQNKLYLPVSTFINSLDSLGLFNVELDNGNFVLSLKKIDIIKTREDIVYKSVPKLKMDVKKITEVKYNAMNELSDSYSKIYSSLKGSFESQKKSKKQSPKKKLEIINEEPEPIKERIHNKPTDFYRIPKGFVRTEIENMLKETDPNKE